MGFRALVIEEAVKVTYSGGTIIITKSDGSRVRDFIDNLSMVMICSARTYASSYFLSECAKRNVPVVFCDETYKPIGHLIPLYPVHNCTKIVKNQINWGPTIKKQLWQVIVKQKIKLQADVTLKLGYPEDAISLFSMAKNVKSADSTNREAAASKQYFSAIFKDQFTRREDNETNACLDYGYALILSTITREILSHGYSTIFGIFHDSTVNQWNLACDFMEPFRPLIDLHVMTQDLPTLNHDMKLHLLSLLEKPVRYKDADRKLSTVIEMCVNDYLLVLEKEKPIEEIEIYELPCLEE